MKTNKIGVWIIRIIAFVGLMAGIFLGYEDIELLIIITVIVFLALDGGDK